MTAGISELPAPVTPLLPFDRTTLNRVFYEAIDRFGPQEAIRFKRDGHWQGLSYRDMELRVAQVASLLGGWKLVPAEGEIQARGPSVMQGYWNQPAATAAAIDADGWFHTGDVGLFDDAGFLHVTDRIKDLIVTAGGKKVAPQPIEGRTQLSPFIAQAVMIGDRRPFPTMLVVPDFERLRLWASEHGIAFVDRNQLLQETPVRELLEQESLGRLHDLAQFEKPKRIAILNEEMTVETGMLTPTFKVKRRMVEQRYQETIQAMYAGAPDKA